MKKKTHDEFIKDVKDKYGDKYEVLGKYINNHTKILVKHNCDKCNNYEYEVKPNNLLSGQGCPKCAGVVKKTTEEFKKEIYDKYGDEYEILGEYVNARTKVLVRHNCKECNNYKYEVSPSNLLNGKTCPICGKIKRKTKLTKTHNEFLKEITDRYEDEYIILNKYINDNTKIWVRHNCEKCNYHEYKVQPTNLLQGRGCPVCSGREAKLGVNTIWDTDRWMCGLGISEEDAKKYKSKSNKKIAVICPNCGKKKEAVIYHIYANKSIGCPCGDGKSYPEKFTLNLLEQLDIEFETEYKPRWIDNKRYDFYIPKLNIIIEAHGIQHYKEKFIRFNNRTFEEEQANDKIKREIALANGIKYYIELDCRESNLEYIKNSILHSELNKLFDLSKVDWQQCAEFANKNIVKEVCNYWSNKREDETTVDLGNIFNLSRNSIINYLKRGTKLGWCDYDPKEEMRKSALRGSCYSKKKVEIFKDKQSLGVFESCRELERQSKELFGVKLLDLYISDVCRNKKTLYKGFIFKYVT